MSTYRELMLVAFGLIQVIQSVDIQKSPSACQPYEEGSDIIFQCTDSNRSRDLFWYHNNSTVISCLHNSHECLGNYDVVRENGISTLSIGDIDRNDPSRDGLWRCGYDSPDEELYRCDLIIYHAPEMNCIRPVLTQVENQLVVVVNCSAFNVFPTANCTFFRRISLNNDVELQASSYRQENARVKPLYFNIFCGLTYKITDDLVGDLTFFLQMSMAFNKTYDSNQTSIHIEGPKPHLLEDCFYVREDNVFWPTEMINCTCEIRDIDNSTIEVEWSDPKKTRIIKKKTIGIRYKDKDITFTCEGTSRSGRVYNISFFPNFAVPAKVIQFTANGERDLNVENGTVVEFNCEVDSKPRGTVYITDSSGQRLDGTSKLLTCDDTGIYTCLAFNDIFSSEISRQYVHVSVKCNPWLVLIISGSNTQQVYTETGANVSIEYKLIMQSKNVTKYEIIKDDKPPTIVLYADHHELAASGRYLVKFEHLRETQYKVTLNIFNIQPLDFGLYTFKIHGSDGDVLDGKFEIKESIYHQEWDTYSILASIITAILSLVILLQIIRFVYLKIKNGRAMGNRMESEKSGLLNAAKEPHRDMGDTTETLQKQRSTRPIHETSNKAVSSEIPSDVLNRASTSGNQDLQDRAQTIPKIPSIPNRGSARTIQETHNRVDQMEMPLVSFNRENASSNTHQRSQGPESLNPINPSSMGVL